MSAQSIESLPDGSQQALIGDIRCIGIVGAGTMGQGIAQVCAQAGYAVVLQDIAAAALDRALKSIGAQLDRQIKKESLDEAAKAQILARIHSASELDAIARADLIIEAATEQEALKRSILTNIDALAKPQSIVATNTSSISITALAATSSRPERFVGMHFFNPVPVMQLVEIISGLQTSEVVAQTVAALARALGKTPIGVKNSAGFVVNRLLCPMINEAIFALQEGLARAEDIDAGMRLGCNHPIGPLALCDMIGLDVQLAVMEVLYASFNDTKYRPAPLLKEMVAAGRLGRKTGWGFYRY
ncbi:MAG: 3-hydroxybutyryl-CoA dehydrogenase [Betaproteobacteria bacterium]|nr:3-hydroxybutyryl-CoA dehydrogenase [Betaproteobacteria bacterium]NCU98180.1 3-hydroxybutyryl-CoA dehydrogenase [Betaproteobacteria bacterium]NCV56318.1 3-hydroxybutyryl-CoA dehydrogenase [Betaproteobacteria bacterium]NCZ98940.1 3-hydroxybutyryl-CoA dehydrogenase [Betaproteobacteria bacterium]